MEDKTVSANASEAVQTGNMEKIPTKEKIFYGCGALMDGGGVALMSCIMLGYMTKALGIAIGIASTIMMISKIWDAITDPLMGLITDGTRSKWGRRRPYMVLGGAMLIVAIFLLFAPIGQWGIAENAGKVAWVLIFYIFWNTCSTISQVPYTSMASDISPSFKERNNANTVKLVFSAVASGLAYIVPLVLLELYVTPGGKWGFSQINAVQFWLAIAIIFGTLFGGGLILSGFFTKERVLIPEKTVKDKITFTRFLKSYIEPFKNKSYRWHIVMYASAFMCMDILSALAVYYATDVWHGAKLFGMDFGSMFIVAPLMVAAVLAFPLARIMMDKKSKQFAFRMGLPFYIAGGIMMAVMSPSWAPPILVPIVAFFMGLGFGGAQMMPWIIFPDTLDVCEFATGDRPTGNYSGMMTLIRKIAGAIGVGMIGWVLDPIGYISNDNIEVYQQQSDEVLLAVRLFMGLAIALLISIALVASFRYKVNNKKLTRMRYYIDRRQQGTFDALTDEEKAEVAVLMKDYK